MWLNSKQIQMTQITILTSTPVWNDMLGYTSRRHFGAKL